MVGHKIERSLSFNLRTSLPDGLNILVCGAYEPLPDLKRSSTYLIVKAGATLMLFDADAAPLEAAESAA